MFGTLLSKLVRFHDEVLPKAVGNGLSQMWYKFVLALLVGVPLLIVASPALILFSVANKTPEHRDTLETVGVAWMLILLLGIIVSIIVIAIKAIQRARHKHEAIQQYDHQRDNKRF